MNPVLIGLFALLSLYAVILLWLAIGFLRTSYFKAKEKNLQMPLTLIICARNEEKNISICLNSLLKQEYVLSKVQLLLINDASSDQTVQRAEAILRRSAINYKIITNVDQKGKKESITYAMQFALNEVIVLRDADTFTLSPKWLQSISDFYQNHPSDLIIAPVAVANHSGLLWALQCIENNVLTVLSCGAARLNVPFLCSGANLIFTKSTFEKTGGYSSHKHIASGDDIFFLEDVKKIKGSRIGYLKSKESIVYTYPCFSFKTLIKQKIRWASKVKQNTNKLNLMLSATSFLSNLAWLCCFVGLYFPAFTAPCLLFIFLKLIIDILLLFLASGFIKNKQTVWYSLPVGCVYPIYACMVGVASLIVKPDWK